MTYESQRIAIAQACKKVPSYDSGSWPSIPDYLNDLNAMHEAEKVLTIPQKILYKDHLTKSAGLYYEVFATSAQRAEAFLKTLGLWKE